MNRTAHLAKLIGTLFCSPIILDHEEHSLINTLKDEKIVEPQLVKILNKTNPEQLYADYQRLFEGCGEMPAPPWGSVYLDKEQVLFGNSTLRYRRFLGEQKLQLDTGMREPEDQFGLMLLALASLIESQANQKIINELLAVHLLPWAYHYLSLVEQHSQTDVYRMLAGATRQWLQHIQQEFDVTPEQYKIYFK